MDAPPEPRNRILYIASFLRALPAGVALLFGLVAAPNAGAQSTVALTPSAPTSFTLAPGEHKTFAFDADADTASSITFEQTKEMLTVIREAPDPKPIPRTNDAGLHSLIRFTVAPNTKSHTVFDVSCLHTQSSCAGIVTLSAPHPASRADSEASANEEILAQAEDLRRHGNDSNWHIALEKYRAAAEYFRAANDGMHLRAALNGEARLQLFRLSDYHAAHDAVTSATQVDTAAEDLQGQGLAWKTLSSVEYFLGDYPASIAAGQKAIALYTDTGDEYWQGILLGNLAYTYREIGDTDHALEYSAHALAIARRIHDEYGVAFNLEALATVHLSRGELEQAFELYYQALDATHLQPYPSVEAAIESGLGDLYIQLNDDARAEDAYQKALPLAKDAHDEAGTLKIISSLGELYARRHRSDDALKILRDGLNQATQLGLVREQSILLASIARNEAALGDTSATNADFHAALDAAKRINNHDAEANALLHLGDFQAQTGDAPAAIASYESAADLWLQESNRAQAATAQASLARLRAASGDLPQARASIDAALANFENSRATIASRELRTSFFSSKHAYYDLAIEILMRLHAADPSHGYDAEAFAVAERASSRALLDELSARNLPAFVDAPAELERARKENRSRLDALYTRLRTLAGDPAKKSAEIPKVRAQIEDELRAGDTLDARIRAASGTYAAIAGETAATPQEIAAQIGPHAALAKYWIGARAAYLWLIDRTGFHTFTLPANHAQVSTLADRWLIAIQTRAAQKTGESLAEREKNLALADRQEKSTAVELGKLLLSPLAQLKDVDRLYIIPDGPLASIPFAALRIPANTRNTSRPPSTQTLISRYEIIDAPSAAILALLANSRAPDQPTKRIAVVADAVYTSADPRVAAAKVTAPTKPTTDAETLRLATEAGMANLPRLTGSRDEARAIASLNGAINTTLRLGFQADADAVRDADWSSYEVAHFGVHALMNPDRPTFSGVVLSMVRPNGAPQNGVLWISGIYDLKMPVPLVVLSGCHTANGREIPGEGLEGLSRAFFFAGARAVVGSLWSVEDRETSILMQRFYRNMIQGKMAPAAALRRAQIDTAADPATAAPFHWAGFTVQGDGAAPLAFSAAP